MFEIDIYNMRVVYYPPYHTQAICVYVTLNDKMESDTLIQEYLIFS